MTRDEVAAFWGIAPSAVSYTMNQHHVPVYDRLPGRGGQSRYRADLVRAAKAAAPGQGARTDRRDHSLATCTDWPYLFGRLLAAVHLLMVESGLDATMTTAVDRIRQEGGYAPAVLRQRLPVEWRKAVNRTQPGRLRDAVIAVYDELVPGVTTHRRYGTRLSEAEETLMMVGFHHQHGALTGPARRAAGGAR